MFLWFSSFLFECWNYSHFLLNQELQEKVISNTLLFSFSALKLYSTSLTNDNRWHFLFMRVRNPDNAVTLTIYLLHREDVGNREHSPSKPLLNSSQIQWGICNPICKMVSKVVEGVWLRVCSARLFSLSLTCRSALASKRVCPWIAVTYYNSGIKVSTAEHLILTPNTTNKTVPSFFWSREKYIMAFEKN